MNTKRCFGSGTGLLDASTAGYMIATNSNTAAADVLDTTSVEIQPGKQVTVILQLDDNVKVGRNAQFKIATANGAVFVGTVIAGQQTG